MIVREGFKNKKVNSAEFSTLGWLKMQFNLIINYLPQHMDPCLEMDL